MDIQQILQQYRSRTEQQLEALFNQPALEPRLPEAMRYSLLNGGKRLRPTLVYLSHRLCSQNQPPAPLTDRAAVAIECIHSYSLIHDDLPAMDDDDLRRGKPTCHIAYDEATAILAGDALQCLAFEQLSEAIDPELALRQLNMMRVLARASGFEGMVAGQAFDLCHVGQMLNLEQLQAMHACKTGALITAAVELGALSAGEAEGERLEQLRRFGALIGLAFQVQDDLLDIEGDTTTLGKPQGSDQAQNKPTYPALLGLEGARKKLHRLHHEAVSILRALGPDAEALIALTDYIVARDH